MEKGQLTRDQKEEFLKAKFLTKDIVLCITPTSLLIYWIGQGSSLIVSKSIFDFNLINMKKKENDQDDEINDFDFI